MLITLRYQQNNRWLPGTRVKNSSVSCLKKLKEEPSDIATTISIFRKPNSPLTALLLPQLDDNRTGWWSFCVIQNKQQKKLKISIYASALNRKLKFLNSSVHYMRSKCRMACHSEMRHLLPSRCVPIMLLRQTIIYFSFLEFALLVYNCFFNLGQK